MRDHFSTDGNVAPCMPGLGCLMPEGWEPLTESYADWLVTVLECHDRPVDLVGHDWAGILMVRAVSLWPGLVASWVTGAAGAVVPRFLRRRLARTWQTASAGEQWMDAQLSLSTAERVTALVPPGVPKADALIVADAFDRTMADAIRSLYRSAVLVPQDWDADFADVPRPGSCRRPRLVPSLRSAKLSALPSGTPAGPAPGCVRPRGRATGGCSRTQRRWRPSSRSSGLLQMGTRKQRGSVGRLTRTSVGFRPSVLEVRMLDRAAWPSGLGKGLQSPVPQFDSGRRLQ